MDSFKRLFKYVWPQWPRIIVAVMAAFIIAILFAGSFATIIPLLKVMVGQEGLHGWADRKVCNWRYDVNFTVPESADMDVETENVFSYLRIISLDEKSVLYKAGLRIDDKIVAIEAEDPNTEKITRSLLLQQLANLPEKSNCQLKIKRLENADVISDVNIEFQSEIDAGHTRFVVNSARKIVGYVPRGQKMKAVTLIIMLMMAVTTLRCIARFYQQFLAEKIVQVAIARFREDTFSHVMTMPVGYFVEKGTSDTTSRLTSDIGGAGKGIKILLGKALREPLKAAACLVAAMMISWQLVLVFIGCAPVAMGLAVVLGKRMKKYTKKSMVSGAELLGKLQGVISALTVVKVYNRQKHERKAYTIINQKMLKRHLRAVKIYVSTGPIMEVIGMIAGSGALLIGVRWITKGQLDPTSFFALLIFLGSAAESIRKSSDIWNKVQSANAAAERVFEIVDTAPEIEKPNAKELKNVKGNVEFRNIVFTYPSAKEPVLKSISFKVEAGCNVAIVGGNGSGKTTLMNLLPRFYDIDSGQILIDGVNIDDVTLSSLRKYIGLVTQNVVTFNDTIAANIAYGRPDATKEEIVEAAKKSFAHEFIDPLENGYDTMIGEHGAGLSGGQLQRIVIARAILNDPKILIFDEATSQVDANSEAKIHKAVESFMKNRTSFVIAHRFSTVVSADVIVVLDEGRIVATGNHQSLMETSAVYRALYETQLMPK